jgi:replicative DNA helicase
MATSNKTTKLTPFQEELVTVLRKVNEFKEACEANVVAILYKQPELIYETNLKLKDFNSNVWRVYYTIANDLIQVEDKKVLDEITVGLYLEKHSKLSKQYDEYKGYQTIINAGSYVKEENFDGYIKDLKKWDKVIQLAKWGFPVKDRLSDYCDMKAEDIYNEFETFINHMFMDVEGDVKSYNVFDGLHELIDKLDEGRGVGLPLHNCEILNKEIGGLNPNGNIYGLGANSGIGKSTTAINYIFPSIIKYDEKLVMMINEEDQTKVQRELLIWVANNIFKEELHKYILRDGKFSDDTKKLLRKCADWLTEKKDNKNITVIPLERYSVKTAIKIIKKYSGLGCKYFILDTLKESCDAKSDEIFKSMMRDTVELYDVVKPSAKNVCLFMTYQLGKASIKQRYLTNNEIGQAKSIVDVMSVNLMMRKPFDDEYAGGKREVVGYKLEGKNGKSRIPFKLDREKHYMIMFIPKNRFGQTDAFQIISEYNLSTNVYRDIGITNIVQDF